MSLELDPTETLQFEKPLDRVNKQVIVLKNPSNQVVAFKVKTTAPKLYCVRPNVGRLEPFASETVSVFLQPLKRDPTECSDKFLILSVSLGDPNVRTTEELHAMWTHVESKERKRMTHYKLNCEFIDSPFPAIAKQDQAIEPEEQIPHEAEKDQTIYRLNQTIQELKQQLVGYKEEVVDLRQRKPAAPTVKYVPEIKYVSRPAPRVVAQTTYPGSAVVAVALVAFLLGYLVIRAT